MSVHLWDRERVPIQIPRWSPVLARALPWAGCELEDVWGRVLAGTHHLWTGERSAAVVTVTRERTCAAHIFLAAGDRHELVDILLPTMEHWARSLGATEMTLAGRAGWARALHPSGYREPLKYLAKEL